MKPKPSIAAKALAGFRLKRGNEWREWFKQNQHVLPATFFQVLVEFSLTGRGSRAGRVTIKWVLKLNALMILSVKISLSENMFHFSVSILELFLIQIQRGFSGHRPDAPDFRDTHFHRHPFCYRDSPIR
jgi:hypothetical protein